MNWYDTDTGGAGRISGVVTDAGGNPVPYADVHADTSDYADSAYAQTDGNGEFSLSDLADNTWIIYAYPPYDEAYGSYGASESVEITTTGASITLSNPLALIRFDTDTGKIEGQITLPDGQTPVSNAHVWAETNDYSHYAEAVTAEDGSFSLTDLADGIWIVHAYPHLESEYIMYGPSEAISEKISGNAVTLSAPLRLTEPPKRVHGTVMYEGSPPEFPVEVVAINWETLYAADSVSVITDADGQFDMWVGSGAWEVWVPQAEDVEWISPGSEMAEFAWDDTPETVKLTLNLEKPDYPGHMTGRVLDPDGTLLMIERDTEESLQIGLCLNPDSEYSFAEDLTYPLRASGRSVTTAEAAIMETEPYEIRTEVRQSWYRDNDPVIIILKANESFIRGILKNAETEEIVSGIPGTVFVTSDSGASATQMAEIDSDGSFKIPVAAGVWHLSYELLSVRHIC